MRADARSRRVEDANALRAAVVATAGERERALEDARATETTETTETTAKTTETMEEDARETVEDAREAAVTEAIEEGRDASLDASRRAVTDEDVALLDAYLRSGFGLVHADGRDSEGRIVVTINATRIPGWAGSADRDNALQHIVHALGGAADEGKYVVVVYFGDDDRTKGVVPSNALHWLRDVHDALEYKVRKNVDKIIFVNASWITSALISISMTFASSKASKKFVWTKSLDSMDKDTGYHVSAAMCGETFLRSVGRTIAPAEPATAAVTASAEQ